MEQPEYKYDIALSFANEDLVIAKAIVSELKRLNIKPYLFTEEITLASNITANTWNVYTQKSRFVLVLISKYYKQKKWSGREWDAIQTVRRQEEVPYMIPLRIDDTELPGLHPDVIFLKWEGNASHMAISLFELMYAVENKKKAKDNKKKKKNRSKKEKKPKSAGVYITSKKVKGNIISGRDIHGN